MAEKKSTKKVNKKNTKDIKKSLPLGVKICSILYYISAVFFTLLGLSFIFGASLMSEVFTQALDQQLPVINPVVFVIMGLIFVLISVLMFFIGRGLWKLKQWARIIAIIFAVFFVMSGIISILRGNFNIDLIYFIANLFIGWYLLFTKEAKKIFS